MKMAIYKKKLIYVACKDDCYFYVDCFTKTLPDGFFVDMIQGYRYEYEGKIPIDQNNRIEFLYTIPGWDDSKEKTERYKMVRKIAVYKNTRVFIDSVADDYYIGGFFGSKPPDGLFIGMQEIKPMEFWGRIPKSEKDQIQFLNDIED